MRQIALFGPRTIMVSALLGLCVACPVTEDSPGMTECPAGLVREGNVCVNATGQTVAGCSDDDAANFDSQASEDDGSCIYTVSFAVDMSEETFTDGILAAGDFGNALALTDGDEDGIFEGSIDLAPGTYTYNFVIDSSPQVTETVPSDCSNASGARELTVLLSPVAAGPLLFGGCAAGAFNPTSVDFEADPTSYTFSGFEGGVAAVIANPFREGINTSAQVGRIQKFMGATFAGSTLQLPGGLVVEAGSSFTVKVYASRAVPVTFKLEDGGAGVEIAVNHSGSGWEELTFDLSAFDDTSTGFTFIFDNGVVGAAMSDPNNWTFYVDDITLVPPAGPAQIDLPITFEAPDVDYTLADFEGAVTTLTVDPTDGENTVASTLKPMGASAFAGTTMSTPAGFANPIPFSVTDTTIGVRVYSPDVGIPVRLKAENVLGAGSTSVETERPTLIANQWHTLVFDFSNQVDSTPALDLSTSYNYLSIFFNVGTDGDTAGDKTYLWDDVEFGVLPDTTAPTLTTVSIASDNVVPTLATTGDVVTLVLTADEVIREPTITIGGEAPDELIGSDDTWTATRALTAGDADGEVTFTVDYEDLNSNAGTQVTTTTDGSSVTLDATAPTVAIVGAPMSFTTLNSISVSVEFSEDVTGFGIDDIAVTNGSADPPVAVDATTYTVDVDPTGFGNLILGISAGAAADGAGNFSTASGKVTILNMLSSPPLSTISISSNNAVNSAFARTGDTVTIQMEATEAIMTPTVTIAGEAADSVTEVGSMDGTNWEATRVVQAGDAAGEVEFVVDFFYLDGREGPQSSNTTDDSSVTIDRTAPTLNVEAAATVIASLDPIAVTFTFDEEVTGFEAGDVGVTNGTIGALSSMDNIVFTGSATPDGNGDLVITVNADVATDLAGNGNTSDTATVFLPVYQEVWSDNFDGPGLDGAIWTARTDADCPAPCDGEQSYLSGRVSVGGGLLTITAQEDAPNAYTSGFIDTFGKREFKYGRVEIDARMPATLGAAPTLTLLPVSDTYGPWPQSGEVVIADAPNLGGGNSTVEQTLHYGLPPDEDTATTDTEDPTDPDMTTITYAVEWEAGEIRWFVDGTHVSTQTSDNWYSFSEDANGVYQVGTEAEPFDQDFYLAIGLSVTSDAGMGSSFPQTLEIDAVRVFECANPIDPEAGTGCGTGTGLTPVSAPDAPYSESLEVYSDAPATLGFINPSDPGNPVSGTLVTETDESGGGTVSSNPAAMDGGNTVWNVDINASGGNTGGVFIRAPDAPSGGFFDFAGSGTAGELLFRMRVASGSTGQIFAGFDSEGASAGEELSYVADDQWQEYSVKIADLVDGTSLDLEAITNPFYLEVVNGAATIDLDDIEVLSTCRDTMGCEATPRLDPATVLYSQDFEAMSLADPDALADDDWVVFGSVFQSDGTTFIYGYGTFPAPNIAGPAFSSLVDDQGGATQGSIQLSVYNDYNNADHGLGRRIEASVFREQLITADEVGKTLTFSFDAKRGNIALASTANGFIKVLSQPGFNLLEFEQVDTTSIPATWNRYTVTLNIGASLLGQLLQFGFSSTASNFEPSGIFYDNIEVITE